ncbi:vacuolar protein sorting 13B isoform X2 [Leptinotarsa decemlineata]
MTVFTESVLLERTPAFAFDYLYHMEVPSDVSSDKLSDMGSNYEFSNLSERSCIRNCFGPFKLRLCSGFFHRMSSLQVAASYYDYPPYYTLKPDLPLQDLLPPSEEDFDALSEFIPSRSMRVTFFAPIIELELMDHPFFQPHKGLLFRKRKKMSSSATNESPVDLPKLTLECQFLDISINYPMYVNRLVHTTCQLPDPPKQLFDACFSKQDIKILGVCSRLVLNSQRHTTILTPSSMSYSNRSILKPQYWTNPDIPHDETTFESESITLNGTNAKMMVIVYIIGKLMKMDSEGAVNIMNNTSILSDASIDYGLPYMELCVEGIRFKKVITNATVSMDVSLGSIKAFIFEPVDVMNSSKSPSKDIQQVLFISGPEPKSSTETKSDTMSEEQPLFTVSLQYPINPDVQKHPPILLFNLQEIRICVDPLLCRWLLYTPKQFKPKVDQIDSSYHKNKNYSEASGSAIETPRRVSSQLESIHSSSDRELPLSKKVEVLKEESVDLQEKVYNLLKRWFDVWKGMYLHGDISQCTIYFPMVSLSAVGSQGIQEAVDAAVNKEHPPDIMVITLPFANIRSAHKHNITKYLKTLPVTLPESIWSPSKSSFPWTISISDLSCFTIQYGNKLIFLKPVSLSATVGLSTRPSKVENEGLAGSSKTDIAYLGICVHIDMTPILISTSEVQVYLFASILYGLMEVATNLMPEKNKLMSKTSDVIPPILNKNSSTLSPTVIRETTLDSISEQTPPNSFIQGEGVDDSVKLTAWVQWTITRFTIELLSSEYKNKAEEELESLQPRLKLVVDAEDIVSSLDFQSIYLKIKSKIGSMSVQHYKRLNPSSKWKPGAFLGIVMRLQEDAGSSQHHEDHGFINITITRASCQHTHTLWGAVQKHHKQKKSEIPNPQLLSQSRYITEIVVNIQPIDFIISPSTLRSFYLVIVPLLQIPINEEPKISSSNTTLNFNNQNLPLAYLECQDIRIIMPSVELGNSGAVHDVIVFQVQKICLTPSAVNPICRSPIRPDIYEQAAHARILNIPGSEVEDRQYQLDLIGISVCTSTWNDIVSIFTPLDTSNLKSISENPALEWNNLEHGQPNLNPVLNLWHITEKFDISIIAAPAMVYKETHVICGHSIEVNFITDIITNLSLHQMKLVSALYGEFVMLVEPPILDNGSLKRPSVKFPYSRFDVPFELGEVEPLELLRDSGIETSDMKSLMSSKFAKTHIEVEKRVFPKLLSPLPQTSVSIPFDVLITAGKIGLAVYQYDNTSMTSVSLSKQKGKKKKIPKINKADLGYEAEEESLDEKSESHKKYIPLIYFYINQPNAFISLHQLARRFNISCFDLNLKLSGPEYIPIARIPTEDDFPISILETRSGEPDSNTGIFPAFFIVTFSKCLGKTATLDIEISKPTKVLFSIATWGYLNNVRDKIMDAFKGTQKNINVVKESVPKTDALPVINSPIPYIRSKVGDTYSKFQEIKDILKGTNNVNLKLNQIIFSVKSDSGHEVNLGMEKLATILILSSRPEKLSINTKLSCLTLTVVNENYRKLLLNPWTFSVDVSVFWESWQSLDSNPQIQFSAESDCISLDISPEQIQCVAMVVKDINEFTSSSQLQTRKNDDSLYEPIQRRGSEKDQHYKDDLRAGAFQFVDANNENSDEQPLPYQVMFWNKNISAMAWRYPQPRALTKVRIFPVPYKISMGFDEDLQVLCYLEYWSECRNCFLPFTQFHLSESEICHLALPEGSLQPIVAATWRVVITMVNDKDDLSSNKLISPRALAACMRIDSYFNKTLIPNITAALYITKIDISLYNYFDKKSLLKSPDCLKNYTSDLLFPENQRFMTLTWYNLTGYLSSWEFDVISTELSSAVKCNVLDYSFLTEQSFVEPFTCKLEINLGTTACCNFISRPIQVKFGPSIAHTLAIASQLWDETYKTNDKDRDFIIMTRFVICNNTNSNLRFGQTSTDEDILLSPRQFHMYSWRSHKKKQQLKVALEENEWVWSNSFTIFEDGMQTIQFNSEKNVSMFINVEELSATQKKVTISGQLVISNMLMENFELKVMEAVTENKEAVFKNTPTHIVSGRNSTCSIFINNKKKYFLRLRFYGLESAWTGDIPLREHSAGSQPWLVKVPLQERGQFLSIWCRIIVQDIKKTKRMLAMFWPLFTVRSNLPVNSKIHIETPTLNVHLDSVVKGKGILQQLYCPGTIDHSHQITFQIDNKDSSSNPYVPLNYSLVDQQKFFKKSENENIDGILEVLSNFNDSKWPYFGEDLEGIDWVIEDQPLTHVQVKYGNACEYSCSLLVELLPWCLTVNNLGVPISIMLNGTELCRIQHHGIVAPPKLEENFNLGICTGGSWCFSEPLQLAKSDWSQTFYMPKITGTIPLEGSIKTSVKCDLHICMISVTSSISNEIRLLKVSSTHVLSNHMSTQVQVICFAVPDRDDIYDFPKNIDPYCFTVAPHSHKSNSGISIIQWHTLNQELEGNIDYALYVSFSIQPHLGWSCPLRVDKPFLRKSTCIKSSNFPIPIVLTCQEYKGQTFIAIHNDTRPQLFIENRTGATLFCAQGLGEGRVATEVKHFRWHCKIENSSCQYYTMPFLSEKFPELPQNNFSEKISIACDPESDLNDFQWSASLSIIHDNEQFLRIPYYGDIKVTIVNTAYTTFLTLDSASQVEISAKDIRVRLSMHESEQPTRLIEKSSEPTAVLVSELFENEDIPRSFSDTSVKGSSPILKKKFPKHVHRSSSTLALDKRSWSETNLTKLSVTTKSLLVKTLPMKEKWNSIDLYAFIKSFSVIFISDSESEGNERWEIASFVCDNIVLCVTQAENMKVKISASDVQFDNQLCSRESYDFPVVLIGQEVKEIKKLLTLNVPIKVLIEGASEKALVMMDFTLETWKDHSKTKFITGVKSLKVRVNPISCYIEDTYITRLMNYLSVFIPTRLVLLPIRKSILKLNNTSGCVNVPEIVSWQCAILARPLTLRKILIEPLSLLLSVHSSVKLYIALDQSPLYFGQFERRRLLTTHYRLGHAMTMHYLSGAIFGAGWVVSSLELLGSPGGLARAMGTGLRDFVSLPYRGLVEGPMAFLRGITQGFASLMKHVTAGTLLSLTKLASSVARNLDRLTLDEEHLKRAEEQRRQRPQGLAQGFMQGLTGLGISLLGAVGGIAHHSLQSVITDGASPRSFVAGVGLGLVGIVTKPLSGAAELVALTGQGLLQGAGWNSLPEPRSVPLVYKIEHGTNSLLKYNWKHIHAMSPSQILYVAEATNISSTSQYESIALILTVDALIIVNLDEDETQRVISLSDLTVCPNNDPTLLVFKLTPPLVQAKSEDECAAEMDPVSRARVADYVKSTKGLLNLPESENGAEHSEIDISPLSSPGATENASEESTVLTYYVNLQCRNYFLCLLALAKQQRLNYNFPVL